MPKVTEAYREARRDEIARAAIRCLARQGFSGTSMADIIEESGLSAGAIYSHFTSKAEIAQHVARLVVTTRAEELRAFARNADRPVSPADIIAFTLEGMERAEVSKTVLLQIWAEATVDAELHAMLDETVERLRAAYRDAVEPWLRATARPSDEAARRAVANTMVILSQGVIVNSALFGALDLPAYVDSLRELLREA